MRTRLHFILGALLCTVAATSLAVAPASALTPYDVPVITCESATLASITLHVCGGATTGAPAGLTIQWMTLDDFVANGNQWYDSDDPRLCKLSLSGQPSLQHPEKSRWELLPGECEDITIGDINFDETGVSGQNCGLDPLQCGKEYVFRWFAHAGRGYGRSDWGGDLTCSTLQCPSDRCTYTQGYWKNHGGPAGCNTAPVNPPDPSWPASVISGGMTIGTVSYTAAQVCQILNTPGAGNGLLTLAHQYIAAKLNLLSNGPTCSDVSTALAAADALIGSRVCPPVGSGSLSNGSVSSLVTLLTSYNEGTLCGPHCHIGPSPFGAQPTERAPWGTIKVRYR